MGLGVFLGADNQAELDAGEYIPDSHGLSRIFCVLLCRWQDEGAVSELGQISQLTGLDLSALYEMTQYMPPEDLADVLDMLARVGEERRKEETEARNVAAGATLAYNLGRVTQTVDSLLGKLPIAGDQILVSEWIAARCPDYFSDTASIEGAFCHVNFQQDLQHLRSFLAYAQHNSSHTVFFVFG